MIKWLLRFIVLLLTLWGVYDGSVPQAQCAASSGQGANRSSVESPASSNPPLQNLSLRPARSFSALTCTGASNVLAEASAAAVQVSRPDLSALGRSSQWQRGSAGHCQEDVGRCGKAPAEVAEKRVKEYRQCPGNSPRPPEKISAPRNQAFCNSL